MRWLSAAVGFKFCSSWRKHFLAIPQAELGAFNILRKLGI